MQTFFGLVCCTAFIHIHAFHVILAGVSNAAFRQLMDFTYTATLAVAGESEAFDVWKAAEYLQMQEAIKALDKK